jgi:excisionase family DNA binding protein
MMTTNERLLLDRKTAAEMLGISSVTLDRLLRAGKGPKAKRIGSRVLFSRDELQRFAGATA